MSEYPLKLRVYEAVLEQPEPDTKVAQFTARGRRSDERGADFVILDPMNGNEIGAYESASRGSAVHDTERFYWVDKVLNE